jgi:hypothetical protein
LPPLLQNRRRIDPRRPKRKVGAVDARTVCMMYAWSRVRTSGACSAGRGSGCPRCLYTPALCGMCVDVYASCIGGGGVGLHWCSLSPPSSCCRGSHTLPTPTRPLQMGARNWRFCDRMRQVCVGACAHALSSARLYPAIFGRCIQRSINVTSHAHTGRAGGRGGAAAGCARSKFRMHCWRAQ